MMQASHPNSPSGSKESQAPANQPAGNEAAPADPTAPPPRKRRWLRRLIIACGALFLVACLLVVFAPRIASQPFVYHRILASVNDGLVGDIALDRLSLRWTGEIAARNVRVHDANQKEVLAVDRVAVSRGVWSLWHSPTDPTTVTLHAPHAVLAFDDANQLSLVNALMPKAPSHRKPSRDEPSRLDQINATIVVRDGEAELRKPGSAPMRLADIQTTISAPLAQNKTDADISFKLPGGETLKVTADASDLLKNGFFARQQFAAGFTVKSDRPVDLAPLLAFISPQIRMRGRSTVDLTGQIRQDRYQLEYNFDLDSLEAPQTSGIATRPLDISLTGQTTLQQNQLGGTINLAGSPGTLNLSYALPLPKSLPPITTSELVSALLTGHRGLGLPALELSGSGRFDLAAVDEALPGIVNFSEATGARLVRGQAELATMRVTGGDWPVLDMEASLTDAKLQTGEQSLSPGAIHVSASAALEKNVGLRVNRLDARSDFLTVTGQGTPDSLKASLNTDLARWPEGLAALILPQDTAMAGRWRGDVQLRRENDQTIRTSVDLHTDRADVQRAARHITLRNLAIQHAGRVILADGQATRIEGKDLLNVHVGSAIAAEMSGWYSLADGRFDLQAALPQVALAEVGGWLDGMGVEILPGRTTRLTGDVAGTVRLARSAENRIDTDVTLSSPNAAVALEGGTIDLNNTHVQQRGHISLNSGTVHLITADEIVLRAGDDIDMTASGAFAPADGSLHAEANITRVALSGIDNWLQALGTNVLHRHDAECAGNFTASRVNSTQPIRLSGHASAKNMRTFGKPLSGETLDATFTQIQLPAPNHPSLRVGSLTAQLRAGQIEVQNLAFDTSRQLLTRADIQASGNVHAILDHLATITAKPLPVHAGGQLAFSGTVTGSGGGYRLEGGGAITPLDVAFADREFHDERFSLMYAMQLDPERERLDVEPLRVSSTPLSINVSGRVEDIFGDMNAGLHGQYRAEWAQLTELLHDYIPASAKLVTIDGTAERTFFLNGPLSAAVPGAKGAATASAGGTPSSEPKLQAQTDIAWDGAEVYGVKIGPGSFPLRYEPPRLEIRRTTIPNPPGRVNVAGELDFSGSTPRLRIPGQVMVLQDVALTREVSRDLVSRINPVFYQVLAAQGGVNLVLQDIDLPLNGSLEQAIGNGQLTLSEAKVQPAGLLSQLLALGLKSANVDELGLDIAGGSFNLNNGRIYYRGFQLLLPDDLVLEFRGSVGFDDTLDLSVSVPVTPALLRRIGIKGDAAKYASLLTGLRVGVPLRGTRQDPKLEFARVDADALVEQALQNAAQQGLNSFLNDFIGGKDGKKGNRQADRKKEEKDAPLDQILRDILKPKDDDKKKSDDDEDDKQPRKRRKQ